MRFVTFQREGYAEPGALIEDRLIGIRGAGFEDLRELIAGGADAMDRVQRWIVHPPGSERLDAATARLLAPIPRPPKVICIGLNYRDHAEESRMAIPEVPTVFAKFPTAVTGPGIPSCCPATRRSRITKPSWRW